VTTSHKEEKRVKELRDLGQRAVACADWRWMPGMLDVEGWRILRGEDAGAGASLANADGEVMHDRSLSLDVLPDLTDPATIGCLLALVREAWGDPLVTPCADVGNGAGVWRVDVGSARFGHYPTEAAALVAALEAAP